MHVSGVNVEQVVVNHLIIVLIRRLRLYVLYKINLVTRGLFVEPKALCVEPKAPVG